MCRKYFKNKFTLMKKEEKNSSCASEKNTLKFVLCCYQNIFELRKKHLFGASVVILLILCNNPWH